MLQFPALLYPSTFGGLTVADKVPSHSSAAGILVLPETDIAFLTLSKGNWIRRFGSLKAELDAIVSGRYCIAKSEDVVTPIYCRNHPSWEDKRLRLPFGPRLHE